MKTNAEVVIIGGGIIGSALAFYLTRLGMKDVTILEKEKYIGAGATGKCAGGIRAQFSTEVNIRMSLLSENLFESFREETGEEGIFDQCGYLFLISSDDDEKIYRKNMELQLAHGVPVEWLNPQDIAELAPNVKLDDIIGGTFCGKDGIGDPHVFTQGYATAARRLGAAIELETEVTGITISSGKVTGVETNKGRISCSRVVIAAGPYSGLVGKFAGVDVPVVPVKRQLNTTSPLPWITDAFPMVVDVSSGFYCHRESAGLLMGWADPDTPEGFDESLDPDYTDAMIMKAIDRIPILEEAGIASSWAGLYEVTPDHTAIVGPIPEVEGLIAATGFSGHGFMHGPGIGKLLAEMMINGKPSIDISTLSITRFTGEPVSYEKMVI